MAKIGIGVTSKKWKANLIECTKNHLTNKHDEWDKKSIVIDNPLKKSVTREQGMVKTQLEIMELEKFSLCPHRCSIYCALILECARMT